MTTPLTALISDLHSNWPALRTAVADARARGVRRVVCLGDVIGYGAKPRECLDEVMRLCANGDGLESGLCLQGNHEYALLNSAEDFNANARRAIDWTREELSRAGDRERSYGYWDFLSGLEPLFVEEGAMYAHGSPRDPVREYLLPRDARDAGKMAANFARMRAVDCERAHVCFVGHSHVPGVYPESGGYVHPDQVQGVWADGAARAIVNIGSVGQPRDGDPRAAYAIIEDGRVELKRVEYDLDRTVAAIESAPILPEAKELAAHVLRTGGMNQNGGNRNQSTINRGI